MTNAMLYILSGYWLQFKPNSVDIRCSITVNPFYMLVTYFGALPAF